MPTVQLSLDFARPIATRPAKARVLVAAPPWKDRPATEAERTPAVLWALPSPTLSEGDVAGLRREIHPGWHRHARCAGAEDPEAWFPDPGTPEQSTGPARAACVRCPVRRSCLAEAILGDEDGLWGGLTRRQRRTAAEQLDPDPATGERDWTGLLDGLLRRLTLASVPVIPAPSVDPVVGSVAGGSAA